MNYDEVEVVKSFSGIKKKIKILLFFLNYFWKQLLKNLTLCS